MIRPLTVRVARQATSWPASPCPRRSASSPLPTSCPRPGATSRGEQQSSKASSSQLCATPARRLAVSSPKLGDVLDGASVWSGRSGSRECTRRDGPAPANATVVIHTFDVQRPRVSSCSWRGGPVLTWSRELGDPQLASVVQGDEREGTSRRYSVMERRRWSSLGRAWFPMFSPGNPTSLSLVPIPVLFLVARTDGRGPCHCVLESRCPRCFAPASSLAVPR